MDCVESQIHEEVAGVSDLAPADGTVTNVKKKKDGRKEKISRISDYLDKNP